MFQWLIFLLPLLGPGSDPAQLDSRVQEELMVDYQDSEDTIGPPESEGTFATPNCCGPNEPPPPPQN